MSFQRINGGENPQSSFCVNNNAHSPLTQLATIDTNQYPQSISLPTWLFSQETCKYKYAEANRTPFHVDFNGQYK